MYVRLLHKVPHLYRPLLLSGNINMPSTPVEAPPAPPVGARKAVPPPPTSSSSSSTSSSQPIRRVSPEASDAALRAAAVLLQVPDRDLMKSFVKRTLVVGHMIIFGSFLAWMWLGHHGSGVRLMLKGSQGCKKAFDE
jgi:hypothetical protein